MKKPLTDSSDDDNYQDALEKLEKEKDDDDKKKRKRHRKKKNETEKLMSNFLKTKFGS